MGGFGAQESRFNVSFDTMTGASGRWAKATATSRANRQHFAFLAFDGSGFGEELLFPIGTRIELVFAQLSRFAPEQAKRFDPAAFGNEGDLRVTV